jgi:MYXO-CTERM domain-containing protein
VRVNSSGTFNLLPLETACNGIQVLQIPMPVTTRRIPRSGGGGQASNDPVQFYYLELRTRTGFDESQTAYPTVLVRVGPDYQARDERGFHTWILDMNTSSQGLQGMGSGATFMDPAGGVSFNVQSISASMATIQVTVPTSTGNACTDGGTLPTPSGPTTCGDGGVGGAGTGGVGGAGTGGVGGAGTGGAGTGGVGGAAGSGGAAGLAGGGAGGILVAGSAGAPSAGAGGRGAAGAASGAGRSGTLALPEGELDSGCGCRVQKAPRRNEAALLFGLFGLALGGLVRRRNARAS